MWNRWSGAVAVRVGVLVLTASACGSSTASSPPAPSRPAGRTPDLSGIRWTLDDSSGLGVPLTGVFVTAEFERGRLTGESGCNSYRASYQVDGSRLTIGSDIAGTRKACPPPATAVEQAYLARLPRVRSYGVTGTTLTLRGADDGALLVYTAADHAAAIVGSWTVTSLYTGNAIESVVPGSHLTADFDGSRISGTSGCNDFGGSYRISGGTDIAIDGLVSTSRACADDAVTKQETQYLAALQLARTFRVTGNRLDLLRVGGTIAVTLDASPAG